LHQELKGMSDFWEKAFVEKQDMWGLDPAKSALIARDFFAEKGIKKVLVTGIGYGRNAKAFIDNGLEVTGIEISKTAIALARKHFGTEMTIHHGSVTDMPFDADRYGGVFCYALIHLLDASERAKLIADCYHQLAEGGYLFFTTITKDAQVYGQGVSIGKDRFEMFGGVRMFFYDEKTIQEEFGKYGLLEIAQVEENYPFHLIICKKETTATHNGESDT
jgi:SAM-dependent methyltransferase